MKIFKTPPVALKFKKILNDLNIDYSQVYLFGSRVNGKHHPDSDYDFFIVLNPDLIRQEISRLYLEIDEKVHKEIPHTSFDIKLRIKTDFERYKNIINILDNTVHEEWVPI